LSTIKVGSKVDYLKIKGGSRGWSGSSDQGGFLYWLAHHITLVDQG